MIQRIPSTQEIAAWMAVPSDAIALAEKLAAPAWDLRQAVGSIYTSQPVGVYLRRDGEKVGLYAPEAEASDLALVKIAAARVSRTT